jgi:hypothetical protein
MDWPEVILTQLGITGACGIGAFWLLRESIKKLIEKEAIKDIEKYKSLLAAQASHLSHDLQRNYIKYENQQRERHNTYPELYKLLAEAEGNLSGLYGLNYSVDVSNMTRPDLESQIENFSNTDKQKILSRFDQGLDFKKIFEDVSRNIQFGEAHRSFVVAKNYWLVKQLFLSKKIHAQVVRTVDSLASMWSQFYTCYKSNGHYQIDISNLQKAASAEIEQLKNAMQSELQTE